MLENEFYVRCVVCGKFFIPNYVYETVCPKCKSKRDE